MPLHFFFLRYDYNIIVSRKNLLTLANCHWPSPFIKNLHLTSHKRMRGKVAKMARESEKQPKPKAIIVGGSIAGVSCAHALTLAGWNVVVLEKTCAPPTGSPTGAGLGLDPLAQRLIESWVGDPDSLHKATVPLTIDQVHYSLRPFHGYLGFPVVGVFIFHGIKHFFLV